MSVSVWLFIVVLWQGDLDPSTAIYPVASQAQCEKLAKGFAEGEGNIIENQMPGTGSDETFYTRCELAHGGNADGA